MHEEQRNAVCQPGCFAGQVLIVFRFVLIVCLALGCSSPGFGDEASVLQKISQQLTVHSSLSGQFKQDKVLGFLDTPLISSGSFNLSVATGLNWLVEKPLRSEMTVHNSQVFLDGKSVPDKGVGQFMAIIMQAFMTGDVQGVQRDFKVTGELLDNQWRLLLKPKSLMLRSAVSHIELRGSDFLEHISIFEISENRTHIEFSGVKGSASQLQDRDPASK